MYSVVINVKSAVRFVRIIFSHGAIPWKKARDRPDFATSYLQKEVLSRTARIIAQGIFCERAALQALPT